MTRANVLVLETYADIYARHLRETFPDITIHPVRTVTELNLDPAIIDVLIAFGIGINDALLQRAKNLKWIQSLATGVDHFLRCPSLRQETFITSARGIHGPAMRETVAFLLLSLSHEAPQLFRNQSAHIWDRSRPWPLLFKKTAVVIGVGVGGTAIGRLLKTFGMRTIGISRTPRSIDGFDDIVGRDRLIDVVGLADYVINILPGGAGNAGAIGKSVFDAMKKEACFVNVGRGETVDEAALIECLKNGQISGAGLDVFDSEPLPADNVLWDMPNVIVCPHIGGLFREYDELVLPLVVENMRLFLSGRPEEMTNLITHDH